MPPMTPGRRRATLFPRLISEQIRCLEPFGETVSFEPGDVVFRERERSDSFFVLLEGEVKITREVSGQEAFITNHGPGEFTGELSVLTQGENLATCRALTPCRLLKIDFFAALHTVAGACPDLMSVVIPALAQRRPEAMSLESQREKLASLGVLAAGLAHELNNPASAAKRSASNLRERLTAQREAALKLCEAGVKPEGLRKLILPLAGRPEADPLERSDQESAIGDHLSDLGVDDPYDVAAALVEAGLNCDQVRGLAETLPCQAVAPALDWLANSISLETLASEVEESTTRISNLVSAVKGYSAMDQAPVQNVDVRRGIENTLTILGHQLRDKGVKVDKQFDPNTPAIEAVEGELNQVWTNLIDNAIDAMNPGGTLTIRTEKEGDCLLVEIEDDGPGIPSEIQGRIFDPFFTTKPVGKGTGLGLDIAYKIIVDHHEGDIQVQSEPGKTVFQIRLPRQR